ncbi:hypothetical protein E2C01_087748 [Portunus trituberculatus]|uniref:Uncharacterized protein n=1 Tax=Portunus trituberculatus TaxID=210409 RepID=A0A5B7JHB5_PORTR|nr:hypothetical protein [Portunus trituberculatus]
MWRPRCRGSRMGIPWGRPCGSWGARTYWGAGSEDWGMWLVRVLREAGSVGRWGEGGACPTGRSRRRVKVAGGKADCGSLAVSRTV